MAKVEVYTARPCPYCHRAKALLDAKGVDYTEFDITGDDEARVKLVEKAMGRRTVPQIFINDVSVGGSDDLHLLEEQGKLDALLMENSVHG